MGFDRHHWLGLMLLACAAPARAADLQEAAVAESSSQAIERQRPAGNPLVKALPTIDPTRVEPPLPAVRRESLPVPDRWRIMEGFGIGTNPWDPYNPNALKGDKPFRPFARWGPDWFLALGAISDSLIEARRLAIPVGLQASDRPGSLDVFGIGRQHTLNQNLILSAAIIKGNTTFKPPDYEFRIVAAINGNRTVAEEVRALTIDPQTGKVRRDGHVGIQELFFDKHLRNVSERFDFDSVRIGVQPFNSDFRGFIFQDTALGVRVFGTRDNNRWQYNAAAFQRIEKDTNSGLNDLAQPLRRDYLLQFNMFRQDWPVLGHTTQLSLLHEINRESGANYFNKNRFLERPAVLGDGRPHDYQVSYVGINGDGHFGRWNLTSSIYGAFGRDDRHPLAQRSNRIAAGFVAAELSRDVDWLRVRATGIVTTGDHNPFDGKATGFDAVLENPQIAGADTSFWIRQAVPLVGGGGVALSGRNGLLPSLRSSKDQGQANFVNPGLTLFGFGFDADVLPQLRVIGNLNKLDFVATDVLQVLRAQADISRDIGWDIGTAVQYRPFMTQNVVLNASAAALFPGRGFRQLYDENRRGPQYSLIVNLLLSF